MRLRKIAPQDGLRHRRLIIPAKERKPADSKLGRESTLDSGSRCAWPE